MLRGIRFQVTVLATTVIIAALVVPAAAAPRPIDPWGEAQQVQEGQLDEYARCSGHPDVDHRVLAGARGPDPDAPFTYTKYYPERLQVHSGDTVEWCFNGGYDFHDVQFLPGDMDARRHRHPQHSAHRSHLVRPDETGLLGFEEEWLLGSRRADDSKSCGRTRWRQQETEEPCVLSTTKEWLSSSIWDRVWGMDFPGAFATRIDLPPGLYRYHCNLHAQMHGYIEVLPDRKPLVNPSVEDIESEILIDYADAKVTFDKLSDPSHAYDPTNKEWVVRMGATTKDRDVSIIQFMPARIDIAVGDRVRYLGGTDEANTVTFPGGEAQGSFVVNGECKPHGCTGTIGPHGWVGTQAVWGCDPDAPAAGAPMIPLAFIPSNVGDPTGGGVPYGCLSGGTPEFAFSPHLSFEQRAPGDLVVTEQTFHNSGIVADPRLPDWFRTWEANDSGSAGAFPTEFDATFPNAGVFQYACSLHEFMNGVIAVQ